MASAVSIPTIDLSTFFLNEEDREGKKKVTDIIKQACSEYGLFQVDDAGGLEVLIDREWIPVTPTEGALVFHISDVLQVLTNDRFVSHFHQVVRPKGKSRYVFVFFYNLNGDKWVELLPQFSKEIGEPPKYRRFQYKDYFGVRVKEKLNPPARHEDKTTLITFASAT